MKQQKDFEIFLNIEKDNTSFFEDITEFSKVFLEEKDLIEFSGISKKQLDLYLFRNPEITKIKNGKSRFISIKILRHVMKNMKRKNNNL
ncbi:MAG: hypothetical protein WC850_06035 [Candidatus Gracilibacteria bacterium]